MTTNETCRVYIASLSDYNAGILHGVWIDVTDKATMQGEIAEMLGQSPTAKHEGVPAEEYAIHDHEGFGEYHVSEYEDLDTLCSLAEGADEYGPAFLAWASNEPGHDLEKTDFEDVFQGEWDSLADYVADWWEQCGYKGDEKSWWHPSNYTDWERMAHDLEISGDVWTADAPHGKVWVFSNR